MSFGSGANTHKVTINPTPALTHGANYAVNIANGVITDRASTPNNFAGITNDTTWYFRIIPAPTLTAENISSTGATLRIGNHTAKW